MGGKGDFRAHIRRIIGLVEKYSYGISLSVEVFSNRPEDMVVQAEEFARQFGRYRNLNMKVLDRMGGAETIEGSIRHIMDVNEALQAGADIVTVPPTFFRQMTQHPKTDEAVSQFLGDFQEWLS